MSGIGDRDRTLGWRGHEGKNPDTKNLKEPSHEGKNPDTKNLKEPSHKGKNPNTKNWKDNLTNLYQFSIYFHIL
jgi:hypothetical protein